MAFALLLAAGFVLILIETRGLSFFADEWDYLLDRRGLSARVLLTPHGPHLSLVPILIYKVLLAIFGSSSYLPFRCLTGIDLMLLAGTVGIFTRRAWGPWWGLVPVALLIALGPGYTTLLSPFQVGYTLANVGGFLALILLARRTLIGDSLACLSLLVALASSSQGVAFVVGSALYLILRDSWYPRIWIARSWTVILPAVLYALWYAHYGRESSQTDLGLWNTSLIFTINGLGSTVAGLFALTTVASTGLLDQTIGVPIVVAAIIAAFASGARGWRPSTMFWAIAVTMLLLWFLAACSNTAAVPRYFNDPRYLSSNGSILLVLATTALRRPRLSAGVTAFVGLVLLIVIATNTSQYAPGRASLSSAMTYTRAETGALRVMRGVVAPSFDPSFSGDPGVVTAIQAGPFFSAFDKFGSFDSDDTRQLLRSPEPVRVVVDQILQRGENIGLGLTNHTGTSGGSLPRILLGATRRSAGCLVSLSGALVVQAMPGRYLITAPKRQSSAPAVARFASANAASLGTLDAGQSASVTIPSDQANDVPWRLDIPGAESRVCKASG